ncbi:Serine/threonine-protein kinase 25, variant 2 [Schistosoma haematobium]|nr:Serine/threonine-protein kinase 25, variant 2 [Schistosoma haematobium]KAH9592108.1 Serine/threonine-protein kinase 25, variant 2 [Schistosoma haematobium]
MFIFYFVVIVLASTYIKTGCCYLNFLSVPDEEDLVNAHPNTPGAPVGAEKPGQKKKHFDGMRPGKASDTFKWNFETVRAMPSQSAQVSHNPGSAYSSPDVSTTHHSSSSSPSSSDAQSVIKRTSGGPALEAERRLSDGYES